MDGSWHDAAQLCAVGPLVSRSFAENLSGSLLGIGGGVVVLGPHAPRHINIRYAIGASIVSAIATSSGAAGLTYGEALPI